MSITPPMRVAYLAMQAVLVAAWWLSLLYPTPRAWFLPGSVLEPAFVAFLVPDLILVVLGSLLAAVLVLRRSPLRSPVSFCLLGALAYATLYTAAWTVALRAPWPSVVLMLLALAGTTLVTVR